MFLFFCTWALGLWYGAVLTAESGTNGDYTIGKVFTVFFSVIFGAVAIGQGKVNELCQCFFFLICHSCHSLFLIFLFLSFVIPIFLSYYLVPFLISTINNKDLLNYSWVIIYLRFPCQNFFSTVKIKKKKLHSFPFFGSSCQGSRCCL